MSTYGRNVNVERQMSNAALTRATVSNTGRAPVFNNVHFLAGGQLWDNFET